MWQGSGCCSKYGLTRVTIGSLPGSEADTLQLKAFGPLGIGISIGEEGIVEDHKPI